MELERSELDWLTHQSNTKGVILQSDLLCGVQVREPLQRFQVLSRAEWGFQAF